MGFPAHLIIDGATDFNVVESYYRMFPHEMSTKPFFTYNLPPAVRVPRMTFERLLDTMITLRSGSATDNFVIAVHGFHDASDFGLGLAMPLTDNTRMRTSFDLLDELLKLRDQNASDDDITTFETNFKYVNSAAKTSDHFPKGSVARLVSKMRRLQQLKVRIVELRACALGTNPAAMETIGRSMGARFLLAPDRHMFFVPLNIAAGFRPQARFDKAVRGLGRGRTFTNPMQSSEKLVVDIHRGAGVSFPTMTLTNTHNLQWFANNNLWANNNFHGGNQVFVEGMELPGRGFALPSEQAYRDHIISTAVLKGNMI